MAFQEAAEQLVATAHWIRTADDDVEPWDCGWCSESYRRSANARLSWPDGGTARMDPEGVAQFEAVMGTLLADQEVRKRWESEELWGIVASLAVHLASTTGTVADAERQLALLRKARPSVVLMPVANISWDGEPLRLGNSVIGDWDDAGFLRAISGLTGTGDGEVVAEYVAGQAHRRPLVGFASQVPGQRSLAFDQATKRLEELCDTALLLVENKGEHNLWSLRGAWNRPGVRGLAVDRPAVEAAFKGETDSLELASQPLVLDELARSASVHWYSADPFPLSALLRDQRLRTALEWVLSADSDVTRRIRLAARWFAEAFWASTRDDAALSLGVALDALIGTKGGLPGRAMRERFALLEPTPGSRAARADRYDEIFAVRSAVAHGGASKRLEEAGFVRGVQDDVTWTARRLLAMNEQFGEQVTRNLDQVFDGLRWGVLQWSASGPMTRTATGSGGRVIT